MTKGIPTIPRFIKLKSTKTFFLWPKILCQEQFSSFHCNRVPAIPETKALVQHERSVWFGFPQKVNLPHPHPPTPPMIHGATVSAFASELANREVEQFRTGRLRLKGANFFEGNRIH